MIALLTIVAVLITVTLIAMALYHSEGIQIIGWPDGHPAHYEEIDAHRTDALLLERPDLVRDPGAFLDAVMAERKAAV